MCFCELNPQYSLSIETNIAANYLVRLSGFNFIIKTNWTKTLNVLHNTYTCIINSGGSYSKDSLTTWLLSLSLYVCLHQNNNKNKIKNLQQTTALSINLLGQKPGIVIWVKSARQASSVTSCTVWVCVRRCEWLCKVLWKFGSSGHLPFTKE